MRNRLLFDANFFPWADKRFPQEKVFQVPPDSESGAPQIRFSNCYIGDNREEKAHPELVKRTLTTGIPLGALLLTAILAVV